MRTRSVNGLRLPAKGRTPCSGILALLVVAVVVGSVVSAFAEEHEYTDRELLAAALEVYNDFADTPLPFLDSEQLDRLANHRIVKVRKTLPSEHSQKGHREEVVGYSLVEAPRTHVWLAALDPDFEGSDLLTEVRLRQNAEGGSLWFQYISLPWPVSDRYWVIELQKDSDLARRTEGFVWQHSWNLVDNGPEIARATVAGGRAGDLRLEDLAKAVYVPMNRGAWILFALDRERTLLAYRVSADVGGSIPESWIATFAMAQLDGLLEKVVEHSKVAFRRYDPDHYVIFDGVGRPIPLQSAEP